MTTNVNTTGKEVLFSLTAKDFRIDTFRGTGKGGQKRNKTSSGVRITHIASGAVGLSDETRSQHKNKELAFLKMSNTVKFKVWHELECAKHLGDLRQIEDAVEQQMRPWNLNEEVFRDGKWRFAHSEDGSAD